MILTKTDGCTSGGAIKIDDKYLDKYSKKELATIILSLLDKYSEEKSNNIEHIILNAILENYGEYEDLGQCDQCFDYVYRYELEI